MARRHQAANACPKGIHPATADPKESVGGRDLGRLLTEVHTALLLRQVIRPIRGPVAIAPDGAQRQERFGSMVRLR